MSHNVYYDGECGAYCGDHSTKWHDLEHIHKSCGKCCGKNPPPSANYRKSLNERVLTHPDHPGVSVENCGMAGALNPGFRANSYESISTGP